MIWTVLLFLALLSILVLAHEWGHYIAAKKAGMTVEEFGLGFPPRLLSWKRRDGMTVSVNAIPLGGFVKIKGEGGEQADAPDSFARKSIPKRFIVLIAGVLMNLVAAAIIFTAGFMVGMPTVTEDGIAGGAVSDPAVHVLEVVEGSPAEEAGIEVGDRLLSIDGTPYDDSDAARAALAPGEGPFALVLARGEEVITVTVDTAFVDTIGREAVGVGLLETGTVRFPWYLAPLKGIEATVSATIQIVLALVTLVVNLVTDAPVDAEIAGPVGIAVVTGEVAKMGFAHLLQFAAMLSINLAVLNALPIPALDGGRIAFLFLEAIRRKKASAQFEQTVHTIGFALLMLLVLVVTFRDIVGLFN
ncbi:RIP metalloprotease RseP [Candidatus Uhrbacteria bacterium]|nr:RIP metalloprotease RseP [Candidatus Uhrbacteria bacterium]